MTLRDSLKIGRDKNGDLGYNRLGSQPPADKELAAMSSEKPNCPECSNHDQVTSYVSDERSRQKTQLDRVTINTSEEPVQKWSCKRCGSHFSTPA